MSIQDSWQRWYDGLSRRAKIHYHYNRVLFFDDGIVDALDRALGYPNWTDPIIHAIEKLGCLAFGHDMTGGYKAGAAHCVYCGKAKS